MKYHPWLGSDLPNEQNHLRYVRNVWTVPPHNHNTLMMRNIDLAYEQLIQASIKPTKYSESLNANSNLNPDQNLNANSNLNSNLELMEEVD